jgi:hypothetical protein
LVCQKEENTQEVKKELPKRLMKIAKNIEKSYEAKGYSHERAKRIGFATIAKKYGWRRGQH